LLSGTAPIWRKEFYQFCYFGDSKRALSKVGWWNVLQLKW